MSSFREPNLREKRVDEITFRVTEAVEGGYVACALGASIVTQADTLPDIREMVRDAVQCHFDEGEAPGTIRLHFVREEIITA